MQAFDISKPIIILAKKENECEGGSIAGNVFPIAVRHLNWVPNSGIRVFYTFRVIAASRNPSLAYAVIWIGIVTSIRPVTRKESGSESWCPIVNGNSANTAMESPVVSSMMSASVTTPAASTMSTASF